MTTRTLVGLLILPLLAAPALAQKWLGAPREINSQIGENIRAIADFDGDGRPDLLVTRVNGAIAGASTFWIGFQTSDGAFVPGPNIAVLAGGYQGDSYALAGDVTGDGLPDVVMSWNSSSGPATSGFVMYRNLGGGAFAPPLHTAVGGMGLTHSGELSDWNADGVRELVVAAYLPTPTGYQVRRFSYQGGGFVSSNVVATTEYLTEVAVGDVNGDGLADTIVGCGTDNRVFVLPTLPGGGIGAMQTLTAGPLAGSWMGRVPSCGDVDGDGDVDLVAGWFNGNGTCSFVLFTNQGVGGLAAGPVQTLGMSPGIGWSGRVHVADLDGDGDGDLWAGQELLYALENGAGSFAVRGATRIARPWSSGPVDGDEGAGTADFDGDGRVDFAGGRSLLYGTGRFERDVFATTISSYVQAVDIDGDGDLDLVESGMVHENRGDQGFVAHPGLFPPLPPPLRYVEAYAFGDFTGDGWLDHVVTHFQILFPMPSIFLGMRLLAGRPDGSVVDVGYAGPPATVIGDSDTFLIPQRDLDGDVDVDIATTGGWWENSGTGVFNVFHAAWTGTPEQLADVNGDGRLDVLTRAIGTSVEHRLFLAQPGGGYVGQLLATDSLSVGVPRARLVDADDDGDLDFVLGSASQVAIVIRTNQGGTFAPAIAVPSRDRAFGVVLASDFDGDGLTDLAAAPAASWGDAGLVWRRLGPGLVYSAPRAYVIPTPMLADADLDGDGDADFYGRSNITRDERWLHPTNGRFAQYGASEPGASGVGPLLGVRGPVRSASTLEVRLRRAPANSFAALDFGLAAAELPGVPFPGLTLRLVPLILLVLPTPGTAGVPGSGSANLPVAVPPGLLGQKFYLQAFTLDANTFGASNGLELVFGS